MLVPAEKLPPASGEDAFTYWKRQEVKAIDREIAALREKQQAIERHTKEMCEAGVHIYPSPIATAYGTLPLNCALCDYHHNIKLW